MKQAHRTSEAKSSHHQSLLIIDDDAHILEYLQRYFLKREYAVTTASDGQEGLRLAIGNAYDLIILDNIMPGTTGTDICAKLRNRGNTTPVLILSGQADLWSKTELLRIGADDYLTKPFRIEELAARVHALLRRSGKLRESPPLVVDELLMDRSTHAVTYFGQAVYLTGKEYKILELLMERKGLLVGREDVVRHLWGPHANPALHALDTHIANLRRKLAVRDATDSDAADTGRSIIVTVPKVGYRIG